MLCDRCVLNVKCEFFVPGGECSVEKKAYDEVVSELVGQYGLGGLVDEILVGRVAMYLIRIARAEVYEANVGVSGASVAWGKYVAGLDGVLRVLLKELALTRAERKKVEKSDVFADVDQLLSSVAKKTMVKPRTARKTGVDRRIFRMRSPMRHPMRSLLRDWTRERRTFMLKAQSG
jgi:hypothetical protein